MVRWPAVFAIGLMLAGCSGSTRLILHNELATKARFVVRYPIRDRGDVRIDQREVEIAAGDRGTTSLEMHSAVWVELSIDDGKTRRKLWLTGHALPKGMANSNGMDVYHAHAGPTTVRLTGPTLADNLQRGLPFLGTCGCCSLPIIVLWTVLLRRRNRP